MVDDFNKSDGGPINVPTYVNDFIFAKKCQRGRLLEIFLVIILGKN